MLKRPTIHRGQPIDRVMGCAVAGLIIVTLFSFLGRVHWILDLFSHFRVQYLQLALLLVGICLWIRRNTCAAALVAVAVLNYAFILPLYVGKPSVPKATPVRAMLMNIHAYNGNPARVIAAITNANPDLLVLEEVTPRWASALSQLISTYPHHILEPQADCFGLMLLSRYPLAHSKIVDL
ncbi:MAG: endonuclease/exonuclease/phosphatase family protein, partial [Pontiella sp.]